MVSPLFYPPDEPVWEVGRMHLLRELQLRRGVYVSGRSSSGRTLAIQSSGRARGWYEGPGRYQRDRRALWKRDLNI